MSTAVAAVESMGRNPETLEVDFSYVVAREARRRGLDAVRSSVAYMPERSQQGALSTFFTSAKVSVSSDTLTERDLLGVLDGALVSLVADARKEEGRSAFRYAIEGLQ